MPRFLIIGFLLLAAVFLPGYRPHEEGAMAKQCASNMRSIEGMLDLLKMSGLPIKGGGESLSGYPLPPEAQASKWPECPLFQEVTAGAREYVVIASGGAFLPCCPFHRTVSDLRFGPELENDPIAGPLVEKGKQRMRQNVLIGAFAANFLFWYSPFLVLAFLQVFIGRECILPLHRIWKAAFRLFSITALIPFIPGHAAAPVPQAAQLVNITALFALLNMVFLACSASDRPGKA